jgi:hypothetical protein
LISASFDLCFFAYLHTVAVDVMSNVVVTVTPPDTTTLLVTFPFASYVLVLTVFPGFCVCVEVRAPSS